MKRDAIINIIKVKLDELTPFGEDMAHPVDRYINPLLDESFNQILREAPLYLLPLSDIDENEVKFGADMDPIETVAYVPRPDDFIRFGKFKFTEWTNEVTKIFSTESPEFKKQQNSFLKGGLHDPVVIETHAKLDTDNSVKRYFKCLDVTGNDSVEYLFYAGNGDIELLSDDLVDPLTWLASGKVLQTLESPGSKFAFERYAEFIISTRR